MWIKLLSHQVISLNGTPTQYQPGDWVDVGKQTALLWISQKLAEKPGVSIAAELVDYTSGLVVIGKLDTNTSQQIAESFPQLEITTSEKPELVFSENLIYDTTVKLKPETIHIGFKHLNTWQLLAPLYDYETLACHVGNDLDQEKLKEIIKETRVPIYQTKLMYVRRCDDTQKLFEVWDNLKSEFTDERLSFLAALYQVKPMLLALPDTWWK